MTTVLTLDGGAEDATSAWTPRALGAVYGVVLNTTSQLQALGDAASLPPYKALPAAPVLYIKPPNTLAGDAAVIALPPGVEALEMGATLAIVIGRTACRVGEAEALGHVLGYAAAIDVCIPHASLYRPALKQRCRDGFLPISPRLANPERVGDPDALEIVTTVNGAEHARWSTSELVRPVARLIADVTDFMTLFPGDVLLAGLSGAPAHAGAGDRVEVAIDGVGRISCEVR